MAKLDNYQLEALNKLKNGSILCGVVGSGKSRVGIAYYIKTCKDKKLYIITTAKKRDTKEWEDELSFFDISQEVVVDSWNNIGKYIDVKNSFFLFDEQRVVGKGTWVKSFLKIVKENQWILLSGTPGDKWDDYIPVFIANGFYKNRSEFLRRHAVYYYGTTYPRFDVKMEVGRLIKLRKEILVTMDYTPPTQQHHIDILCEYDGVLYKSVWSQRWDPYKGQPVENPSELFYLIRKVVNSDESRGREVIDIFKEKRKVIVFYNFDYELEILRNLDYGNDITVSEWNGHKHDPVPDTERWVYLVQYTAGSEGWNCTKTDTIIFYSQSYSYKATVQAAGRIDRRNTKFTDLYYYHLKSRASIDIAIARALKSKRNFNEKGFSF